MFKIIALLLLATSASADGVYFYSEVKAFNEVQAWPEYSAPSPLGVFGVEYLHNVSGKLSVHVGIEHQSSIAYAEEGDGINSVVIGMRLKLF